MGTTNIKEAVKHAIESKSIEVERVPDEAHLLSERPDDYIGTNYFLALYDSDKEKCPPKYKDHGLFRGIESR